MAKGRARETQGRHLEAVSATAQFSAENSELRASELTGELRSAGLRAQHVAENATNAVGHVRHEAQAAQDDLQQAHRRDLGLATERVRRDAEVLHAAALLRAVAEANARHSSFTAAAEQLHKSAIAVVNDRHVVAVAALETDLQGLRGL